LGRGQRWLALVVRPEPLSQQFWFPQWSVL